MGACTTLTLPRPTHPQATGMQSSRFSMQPPSYQSTMPGSIYSQGPNSNSSGHQVSSDFGQGGNSSNRTRSAEREPLLRQRSASSPRRRSWSPKPLISAALTLLAGLLFGYTIAYAVDHLDPIVRDRIRAKWEIEINQHNDLRQHMAEERRQWDLERQAWEEVRLGERKEALEERRRAREKEEEEEEKRRAGIHWLKLERAPHCTKYGTREYQAKLGPVNGGYNQLKACLETEVEIHGRMVKPTRCVDMGMFNGMYGVWMVDFDEGACHTYWGDYNDKGCTAPGSGLRCIEANLKNHDAADEWIAMCTTHPMISTDCILTVRCLALIRAAFLDLGLLKTRTARESLSCRN